MTPRVLGRTILELVDRESALARTPAPTCEITLTDVQYAFGPEGEHGIREVTVSGVAWGTTRVNGTLAGSGVEPPVTAEEKVQDHTWSMTFALPKPIRCGGTVSVHVKSNKPERCDAEARETLTLECCGDDASASGCDAGFVRARNRFVAGHPDRLVGTRIFTPLLCSFWTPTNKTHVELGRLISRVGGTRIEAYGKAGEIAARAAELGQELQRELGPDAPVDLRRVYDVIAKAYGEVTGGRPGGKTPSKRARTREQAEKRDEPAERGELVLTPAIAGLQLATIQPRGVEAPSIDVSATMSSVQTVVASASGEPIGVAEGIEQYIDLGWLGILFYDRLRLRASGLVPGDHVYSLSLAPGEEVTLTQRSETKRTRSFEDIVDRTEERELEFSSTWSTDVSQQQTNTESSSVGGNLGISVGIPIAEMVEADVSGGVNAQSASSSTATRQRARSQQVTSRVTAKAREQHKTTFRVGVEAVEEFGSRRVLRNPNPAHALTLNFYKLYQKYRVILERYDAKLCLSLCIDDPGRDPRSEFEDELKKLDPQVPPGACPEVPAASTPRQTQMIENLNATDVGGDEFGDAIFSTVLPAGTVLSSWQFEITRWVVDDGGGNVYDADPSQFVLHGGNWWFADGELPSIGSGGAQSHFIRVLMPEAWGPGWWTVRVEGRFSWSVVASEAIVTEVRACHDAVKKKIRDSFSQERVLAMLEEVKSARTDLIFKRLVEETLLRSFLGQNANPPCDLIERVRNAFEWNEAVIQYLPWWLTAGGRQRREMLRQRLLLLPGDLRSDLVIDDFLVASAARVYLPIKPGREMDAVALLTEVDISSCVREFSAWRDETLGPVSFSLPTYEEISAPVPSLGTQAGETGWVHDWEQPRRRSVVLDEWADHLPTDGVHLEPALSACGAADALRARALESDLESEAALREAELARAEIERALATHPPGQVTVVIGDPAVRRP